MGVRVRLVMQGLREGLEIRQPEEEGGAAGVQDRQEQQEQMLQVLLVQVMVEPEELEEVEEEVEGCQAQLDLSQPIKVMVEPEELEAVEEVVDGGGPSEPPRPRKQAMEDMVEEGEELQLITLALLIIFRAMGILEEEVVGVVELPL